MLLSPSVPHDGDLDERDALRQDRLVGVGHQPEPQQRLAPRERLER